MNWLNHYRIKPHYKMIQFLLHVLSYFHISSSSSPSPHPPPPPLRTLWYLTLTHVTPSKQLPPSSPAMSINISTKIIITKITASIQLVKSLQITWPKQLGLLGAYYHSSNNIFSKTNPPDMREITDQNISWSWDGRLPRVHVIWSYEYVEIVRFFFLFQPYLVGYPALSFSLLFASLFLLFSSPFLIPSVYDSGNDC